VSHRIKSLWASVRPIARNFFMSDRFDPGVKALTLQPLLLSRLLYNAATWNPLRLADRRRFNGIFNRVLHLVANTRKEAYSDPLVNRRAMALVNIPPVDDILRLQRLAFLPRLLVWAPSFLLRLVDSASHFRDSIIEDIVWLACRVPKLVDMPEPQYALAEWFDLCRLRRLAWKAYLRTAREAAVLKLKAELDRADAAAAAVFAAPRFGYECDSAFRTPAAWRMHAKIKHGLRAVVEAAVHDTYCLACMVEFHTVDRLLQHLQAGQARCGNLILLHVGPATDDGIAGLRLQSREAENARRAARRRPPPATRMPGPTQSWAAG
jgi:hypothetical protein